MGQSRAHDAGDGLRIHVAAREEVERALAREIADVIRSHAVPGRRSAVLGLAAGASPRGVYRELVRLHRDAGLDFSMVVAFSLDEFAGLDEQHPCSFARYFHDELFAHVNVPRDSIHLADGRRVERESEILCQTLERRIHGAGGIDLQLLGIGRNGHVGFNEPGSAAGSRTRIVDLEEGTRADARSDFDGHGEVPRRAITMGVATILDARRLRVLAFGAGKADIVARFVHGPVGAEVPATFLRGHADVELWVDPPAAAKLDPALVEQDRGFG